MEKFISGVNHHPEKKKIGYGRARGPLIQMLGTIGFKPPTIRSVEITQVEKHL